jgi:hypothetical protein
MTSAGGIGPFCKEQRIFLVTAKVIDRDDAVKFQLGDNPEFAVEALAELWILEHFRPKDFERNLPIRKWIIGTVDLGHAPLAQFPADFIPAEFPIIHVVEYNEPDNGQQCISITEMEPEQLPRSYLLPTDTFKESLYLWPGLAREWV